MKYIIKISFLLLLTWLYTFASATPVVQKLDLPNDAVLFSKLENKKLASGGIIYAKLIPLVDISPNLKAAYEKAIELINKGKTSANNLEVEHIIDGKSIKGKLTEVLENGQNVIDENGNKLALLEVDGEKIPVLIAEDGTTSKLAQSADEVVDDASKALVKVQGAGDIPSTLSKITNLTAAERATLKTLLEADADLAKAFAKAPEEMAGAWKSLKGIHPNLAKQADALEAFVKLKRNPSFEKMGLTDEIIAKIEGAQGLSYKQILDNIDNFGNKVSKKNIVLEDFNKLTADLVQGGSKSDGANWIVKYIGDNADDFAGRKLKFEEFVSNNLGGRFVDVSDISNQSKKIFYEFKSVAEVPPGHFAEQFMKDLTNANTLDQIKWMFNGAKNPPNFRTNMLNAIDNLPLTDELAKKLLNNPNATKAILKNELKSKFDNIFKLSN